MTRPLRVILWNAAGVRKKLDELEMFVKDLDADVVLITETHLRPQYDCDLPGYKVYRADRLNQLSRNASGGAAVYVHKRLSHSPVFLNTTLEAVGVALNVGGKELQLYSVYVSPRVEFHPQELDKLFDQGPVVIIGGDFNAKHTSWKCRCSNTRGRSLHAYLGSRWDTSVTAPTTPTYYPTKPNSKHDILDIFICKGFKGNIDVSVFDGLSSDHKPVIATLNIEPALDDVARKIESDGYLSRQLIPTPGPNLPTTLGIQDAVADTRQASTFPSLASVSLPYTLTSDANVGVNGSQEREI